MGLGIYRLRYTPKYEVADLRMRCVDNRHGSMWLKSRSSESSESLESMTLPVLLDSERTTRVGLQQYIALCRSERINAVDDGVGLTVNCPGYPGYNETRIPT